MLSKAESHHCDPFHGFDRMVMVVCAFVVYRHGWTSLGNSGSVVSQFIAGFVGVGDLEWIWVHWHLGSHRVCKMYKCIQGFEDGGSDAIGIWDIVTSKMMFSSADIRNVLELQEEC
ncbi:hypothetical protein AKJ16_DCAP18325 [Drosera capensis]